MDCLVIDGGYGLHGEIGIHGAKNGALPVLAAAVLGGRSVIHNCPRLTDTESAAEILRMLAELSVGSDVTLVMVTHSPEAAAICDRVLTLENGGLK